MSRSLTAILFSFAFLILIFAGCHSSDNHSGLLLNEIALDLSGSVVAPGGTPIEGVEVELSNPESGSVFDTVVTEENGMFAFVDIPAGLMKLSFDGSSATSEIANAEFRTFSLLHTLIKDQSNVLALAVTLVNYNDPQTARSSVTAVNGIINPSINFLGGSFGLMSAAGVQNQSVTSDDGTIVDGDVEFTLSPIDANELPIPLPEGAFAQGIFVSIQPSNVSFDPPLELTLPNSNFLAPGTQVDILEFDHPTNQWINVSAITGLKGTVSADGSKIVAPAAVNHGGWHGLAGFATEQEDQTKVVVTVEDQFGDPVRGAEASISMGSQHLGRLISSDNSGLICIPKIRRLPFTNDITLHLKIPGLKGELVRTETGTFGSALAARVTDFGEITVFIKPEGGIVGRLSCNGKPSKGIVQIQRIEFGKVVESRESNASSQLLGIFVFFNVKPGTWVVQSSDDEGNTAKKTVEVVRNETARVFLNKTQEGGDDDESSFPKLTASDVTVSEGNTVSIPIMIENPTSSLAHFAYQVFPVTATNHTDFEASDSLVSVAIVRSQTMNLIEFDTFWDGDNEGPETFRVVFSDPFGIELVTSEVTVTIEDGDPPVLTIEADDRETSVIEGSFGPALGAISIVWDKRFKKKDTFFVDISLLDGTATKADNDFSDANSAGPTIALRPLVLEQRILIHVNGDTKLEDDETYTLLLTNPVGVDVDFDEADSVITIVDDDNILINIDDQEVLEGDEGSSLLTFQVFINKNSPQDTTVNYMVVNDSATGGEDFLIDQGTVTILANTNSETLDVEVFGDNEAERNETLKVILSNPPVGTRIGDGEGVGVILNDDPPTISVQPAQLVEGDDGTMSMVFTVLQDVELQDWTAVTYGNIDGSATQQDEDYIPVNGTAIINPNLLSTTIEVPIVGDKKIETNETFSVLIFDPIHAFLGTSLATGTIQNDDSALLSIADSGQDEGDNGSSPLLFTISLDQTSTVDVSVDWETMDGSADASDYTPRSGTAMITAGALTTTVDVPILGDTTIENDETFTVTLNNPINASIADFSGLGTIVNDDRPAISINSVQKLEGNNGNSLMTFFITLNGAVSDQVTVDYATSNGSATAGSDYTAKSDSIIIPAGVTLFAFDVIISGDTDSEPNETFTVTLSNQSANVDPGTMQGTGTILDDDATPGINFDPAQLDFTVSGTGLSIMYVVSIRTPPTDDVTIDLSPVNQALDVGAGPGVTRSIVFPAGTTSVTHTVTVTNVSLENPGNQSVIRHFSMSNDPAYDSLLLIDAIITVAGP